MNRHFWDLYAPIYRLAMKADKDIYTFMYGRIPFVIKDREVLEIATGPGLLALEVAPWTKRMIATDYSPGMIEQARKSPCPKNLTFEQANALDLPYADHSFDAVIISNALHIIPEPELALREIRRVLRRDGILIAPNFVNHRGTLKSRIWSLVLRIAGIRFEHQWSGQEYLDFLKQNGWKVVHSKMMEARIAMMYAECIREEREDDAGNASCEA